MKFLEVKFLEVIEMLEEALDCGGCPDSTCEELKIIEKTTGVSFEKMTQDEMMSYLKGLNDMYKFLK